MESIQKSLLERKCDVLCIAYAHNESGIILPIEEVLKLCKELSFFPLFLCDASQLLSRWDFSSSFFSSHPLLKEHGFCIFSSHKIGAGMGTSCFIFPDKEDPENWRRYFPIQGGEQEKGLRPSTHNFFSIHSFRKVLEFLARENFFSIVCDYQASFEKLLKEEIFPLGNFSIVGEGYPRLPGITAVLFREAPIDMLLIGLDQKGIVLSPGTSCKSKSRTPSPSLLAMGYSPEEALSLLRFSYKENFSPSLQKIVIQELKRLLLSFF